MELREYLFRNKLSQNAFSRITGISNPTIHKICTGNYRPSKTIIMLIHKFTNDEVSFDHLPFRFDARKKVNPIEPKLEETEPQSKEPHKDVVHGMETRSLFDCSYCPHCGRAIYTKP